MEHYFQWGDKTSLDLDMTILDGVVFRTAERDIVYEEVLGVSGEYAIDNKRYKCGEITFPVKIRKQKKELREQTHQISRWLNSQHGFNRLYFSDDPNFYYLASHTGRSSVGVNLNIMAKTNITFKLQPYKYSLDGADLVEHKSKDNLFNPYCESSYPKIRINLSGTFTLAIRDEMYQFKNVDSWIEIDSEMKICYDKGGQANEKVAFDGDYPKLLPGDNFIYISGRGDRDIIEITPRWRELI